MVAVSGTVAEAMILPGLNGLEFVEPAKLGLRECWTPCTIDICLWCPYDRLGFLSMSTLCFGREWPDAGVTARGEALRRLVALSALPLVRLGSRDAPPVVGGCAVGGATSSGSGGGLTFGSL